MRDKISVAVIGAGMAGRTHAQAYRLATTVHHLDLPPVQLTAVADIHEPFAADCARRYGYARHETDWRTIAEDPDIDAVSIVVGNALHREIAEAMIAAGKHVLCEKPLAGNLEDAVALAELEKQAARSGLVTSVGYCYRRSPAVAAVADLVHTGELGEISHFNGRYWCDYAADPTGPISWRYRGGPGSGALGDIGSHLVDTAETVCGPLVEVGGAVLATTIPHRPVDAGAAHGHRRGSDQPGSATADVENEDVATFTGRFASGAVGTFSTSRVAFGYPNGQAFDVFGSTGRASFDLLRPGEFTVDDARPGSYSRGPRTVLVHNEHPYFDGGQPMDYVGVGYTQVDLFTYQAKAFLQEIAGIEDGLPRCATFADGLHSMQVIAAVARSAAEGGTTVTL
ncbi:Predicted dehydrogenase [Austwickia chelonae]|uniref:Putative oxidoreductase n=1 Tax=Austwickia chelonae NBRC 105200 TaxID=1184607 RepID=K6VVD3_9MICO|nr:Gfo/Idh/MocA family oxidoreductase [Austwickia chelonae]GAB79305.1 putative oxidoreductase [Austwickia chelonae NBRC 105200]SEW38116.1 Predicted dehydrogenase [Austwickia chelonae]